MELTRRGVFRDCGKNRLIGGNDSVGVLKDADGVLVSVSAVREDRSSYRYCLGLTAEEVLKCLLTLSPSVITDAMDELRDEYDFAQSIPEIVHQLTKGALGQPPATNDEQDDE